MMAPVDGAAKQAAAVAGARPPAGAPHLWRLVDNAVALAAQVFDKVRQRVPLCGVHVQVLLVGNVLLVDLVGVDAPGEMRMSCSEEGGGSAVAVLSSRPGQNVTKPLRQGTVTHRVLKRRLSR